MIKVNSSEYINAERKKYSLYVIQNRAIVSMADGLKSGGRRVLWIARDGKKYKSASLAGAAMCLHPHAAPETTINTLAMPYGNNIPLFDGIGSFGTRLSPSACGASRYTSVKISEFAKDVLFADIEIIPMCNNYDNTLKEPEHFLPLIPLALLNPSSGIAVGYSSTINPRSLKDIINAQLIHLRGKTNRKEPPLTFGPFNSISTQMIEANGTKKWLFEGTYEKTNTTTITIRNLPYGHSHDQYVDYLNLLVDEGTITNYIDNSKNVIDIAVKFERYKLSKLDHDDILKLLKLTNTVTENMNMLSFDGQGIVSTTFNQTIEMFTDWRLQFYINRYERLHANLSTQIQRYRDVITAINNNIGDKARKIKKRDDFKKYLATLDIVHIDYVADLAVYRFTLEEKQKIIAKIKEAEKTLKEYEDLLSSEDLRREVYINELRNIAKQYG